MKRVAIIGAGAAGYFAAINIAEMRPDLQLDLYEATQQTLSKVKISGGGRCNVTHHCFEPRQLVTNYPRGERELRGPFHQFGPQEVVDWFAARGVALRVEDDGRMFPQSNSSQSIIDCFKQAAQAAGVQLHKQAAITAVQRCADGFTINKDAQANIDAVVLATGSSASGRALAASLGHRIVDAVPSLFTFKTDAWIHALAGLSVAHAELHLQDLDKPYSGAGPILCTHWGISGPCVLRASAWAARSLHALAYKTCFTINWLPHKDISAYIAQQRREHGKAKVANGKPQDIPKRLWLALCEQAAVDSDNNWSQVSKAGIAALTRYVHACPIQMHGKTTFKEEFVTAGGVAREEINWKTMESKLQPAVYFAGECIDVDAITGGFNFQNAWTTAYVAAQSIAAQ